MKSSNVPFGDGVEQKQKASTFGTTGLWSMKAPTTHRHTLTRTDTLVSRHLLMHKKLLLYQRKTKAVVGDERWEGLRLIAASSLLTLLLRRGPVIRDLLLMFASLICMFAFNYHPAIKRSWRQRGWQSAPTGGGKTLDLQPQRSDSSF